MTFHCQPSHKGWRIMQSIVDFSSFMATSTSPFLYQLFDLVLGGTRFNLLAPGRRILPKTPYGSSAWARSASDKTRFTGLRALSRSACDIEGNRPADRVRDGTRRNAPATSG